MFDFIKFKFHDINNEHFYEITNKTERETSKEFAEIITKYIDNNLSNKDIALLNLIKKSRLT
jgi:hypothetical protein